MSPSAALLAPLRTVRRSRLEDRNQSEPPTNTPFASPREAQSSGTQCEGGWANARGFTIALDIVHLLQAHGYPVPPPAVRSIKSDARESLNTRRVCRKSPPVKQLSARTDAMRWHSPASSTKLARSATVWPRRRGGDSHVEKKRMETWLIGS